MQESKSVTPGAPVTRTQAAPPSPAQFRPASGNLADVLGAAPSDPSFDLESWKRQWSSVEAELKAITRANDVAEGRGA
jgi:hypothetical protein